MLCLSCSVLAFAFSMLWLLPECHGVFSLLPWSAHSVQDHEQHRTTTGENRGGSTCHRWNKQRLSQWLSSGAVELVIRPSSNFTSLVYGEVTWQGLQSLQELAAQSTPCFTLSRSSFLFLFLFFFLLSFSSRSCNFYSLLNRLFFFCLIFLI